MCAAITSEYNDLNADAEPIAVVGMACRLPDADDVASFWSNIQNGVVSLGPVPSDRFDKRLYYDPTIGLPNKSYTDLGGVIQYRPVDRAACPLPAGAEDYYDKAHLNLCEVASRACIDAGIDPFDFRIKNTGVYIGNTRGGDIGSRMVTSVYLPEVMRLAYDTDAYRNMTSHVSRDAVDGAIDAVIKKIRNDAPKKHFDGSPFTGANCAASLVSQTLKLNGPALVFNSACASSLNALGQAVLALRLGHIDSALVGGASYFHSDTLVLFSYARSLTKNRSCPFDDEADGLIVGEGAVVLLLKRLSDAIKAGDSMHAVIRGVGFASDGKGKSLWAPRKEGQIEAMRRAYGITCKPKDVGYVEAHATSTAIGDATEAEALSMFYDADDLKDRIPIGSVKGNIGHTLEVAGIAGLLKSILCVKHGVIPPIAGLRNRSTKIDWEKSPFCVPLNPTRWEPKNNAPRTAAVNSFGIGGLNVHVVLQEHDSTGRVFGSATPGNDAAMRITNLNNRNDAIAIIGYGCIYPKGIFVEDFKKLLYGDHSAIRKIDNDRFDANLLLETTFQGRTDIPPFRGGVIDGYQYDWRKNKIPPKQIENASPLQFMILDAVNEAFSSAGMNVANMDRSRVGVIVGTIFGGDFSIQLGVGLYLPVICDAITKHFEDIALPDDAIRRFQNEFTDVVLRKMPALIDETGSFTSSALASRITKTFDLHGGAVAIDAENASSLAALQCCADQLVAGANDVMICISGQQDMGPGCFETHVVEENLSSNPILSIFDAKARGFVPGEGCGVVILKKLEKAKKDGNRVYGVIRSIASAAGQDRRNAFRTAFERMYGINNQATPNGEPTNYRRPDFLEIATMDDSANIVRQIEVLANVTKCMKPSKTSIGSIVNRIGHLGGASAMASLLKSLVGFSERKFPAELFLRNPAEHLLRFGGVCDVPAHPETWALNDDLKNVVITSGSYNYYTMLLEEPAAGSMR